MIDFAAIGLVVVLIILALLVCGCSCIVTLYNICIKNCMPVYNSCCEYCNKNRRRNYNSLEHDQI